MSSPDYFSHERVSEVTCCVCGQITSSTQDIFCQSCYINVDQIVKWPIILGVIIRLIFVIWIEIFFGILAGFLVLIPIGAASAPNTTWSTVVLLFGFNFLATAPILACIYTWSLRSWIVKAQLWAIISTIGALLPGLLMFLCVILGLRLTTIPESLLSFFVVVTELCIGIMIVSWQSKYLALPLQNRNVWMRGGVAGWSFGALLHLIIAFLGPGNGFSLWLGSAAAFSAYGIVAHCILAYFAMNMHLVDRVRQVQYRHAEGL